MSRTLQPLVDRILAFPGNHSTPAQLVSLSDAFAATTLHTPRFSGAALPVVCRLWQHGRGARGGAHAGAWQCGRPRAGGAIPAAGECLVGSLFCTATPLLAAAAPLTLRCIWEPLLACGLPQQAMPLVRRHAWEHALLPVAALLLTVLLLATVVQAAEAGDADAMAHLGNMHANGAAGVAQDNATAMSWFWKAADRGAWGGAGGARGRVGLPLCSLVRPSLLKRCISTSSHHPSAHFHSIPQHCPSTLTPMPPLHSAARAPASPPSRAGHPWGHPGLGYMHMHSFNQQRCCSTYLLPSATRPPRGLPRPGVHAHGGPRHRQGLRQGPDLPQRRRGAGGVRPGDGALARHAQLGGVLPW